MSGKNKYTADDLKEFQGIITGKLEKSREDLTLLVDKLSHKDDHGTEDTSPTFKLMDEGSDVLSKEETTTLPVSTPPSSICTRTIR